MSALPDKTKKMYNINEVKMKDISVKPFLKWAGGKGQLLNEFENYFPVELKTGKIENYYEPFLGSGAVFFHIIKKYSIKNAYLSDVNEDLILTYQVIEFLNKRENETNFIGIVGEKIELTLTIEKIIQFDTQYGKSNLYIMKDSVGNSFKKFGEINVKFITKIKEGNNSKYSPSEGDEINFLAEIKEHSIYQGEKQTILGRVGLVKNGERK